MRAAGWENNLSRGASFLNASTGHRLSPSPRSHKTQVEQYYIGEKPSFLSCFSNRENEKEEGRTLLSMTEWDGMAMSHIYPIFLPGRHPS